MMLLAWSVEAADDEVETILHTRRCVEGSKVLSKGPIKEELVPVH